MVKPIGRITNCRILRIPNSPPCINTVCNTMPCVTPAKKRPITVYDFGCWILAWLAINRRLLIANSDDDNICEMI